MASLSELKAWFSTFTGQLRNREQPLYDIEAICDNVGRVMSGDERLSASRIGIGHE
jgi:hypothetical protein